MNTIMRVEVGDRVSRIEYDLDKPLKSVKVIPNIELPRVFEASAVRTPVFPLPTAMFLQKGNESYMLTYRQMPNGFLEFDQFDERTSGPTTRRKLNFPYIYQLYQMRTQDNGILVSQVYIYTSYAHPTINTNIYIPCLPNLYNDGHMCWGDERPNVFKTHTTSENDFTFLRSIEPIFYNAVRTQEYVGASSDEVDQNFNRMYYNESTWASSTLVQESGSSSLFGNRKSLTIQELQDRINARN